MGRSTVTVPPSPRFTQRASGVRDTGCTASMTKTPSFATSTRPTWEYGDAERLADQRRAARARRLQHHVAGLQRDFSGLWFPGRGHEDGQTRQAEQNGHVQPS